MSKCKNKHVIEDVHYILPKIEKNPQEERKEKKQREKKKRRKKDKSKRNT